jgi:hypothetical protein
MTRARRTLLALVVVSAPIAALTPFGCRQILGIQDLGDDGLTCDTYCSVIAEACKGDNLQYASTDACMGLCATFPVGTLNDMTGNTLGCRVNQANTILNTHDGNCAAAGPPGAGVCGTDCESFCASLTQVCPTDFKSTIGCEVACAKVPDSTCPPFFVDLNAGLPNTDSLQCRFYHLTAATQDPSLHCPHAIGENGFCTPVADGGIPCTDGG